MNKLLAVLSLMLLFGCVPQGLFFWGDYSETLYSFKKNPDEKTLTVHKAELLRIITTAPQKRKAVPPGIYAEYGFLLLQEGRTPEGMTYLDKEMKAFPESAPLVLRIKAGFEKEVVQP
jgi:hypothetical protein